MKSHVVESFGAILPHAAAPRVEVWGPHVIRLSERLAGMALRSDAEFALWRNNTS